MKKIGNFLLAMFLALPLAACDNDDNGPNTPTNQSGNNGQENTNSQTKNENDGLVHIDPTTIDAYFFKSSTKWNTLSIFGSDQKQNENGEPVNGFPLYNFELHIDQSSPISGTMEFPNDANSLVYAYIYKKINTDDVEQYTTYGGSITIEEASEETFKATLSGLIFKEFDTKDGENGDITGFYLQDGKELTMADMKIELNEDNFYFINCDIEEFSDYCD